MTVATDQVDVRPADRATATTPARDLEPAVAPVRRRAHGRRRWSACRQRASAQLVGADVATSPEAERAARRACRTPSRSLATSLQTQTERCIGELRGPVLWSETMSARASSFGDEGLFVCKTPSRAYDIDENRVLVAALRRDPRGRPDAAEHNNDRALEDPLLRGGPPQRQRGQPLPRPPVAGQRHPRAPRSRGRIKRTRSGKHRKSYQPALDMLERAAEPARRRRRAWRCATSAPGPSTRVLIGLDRPARAARRHPAAAVPGRARRAVLRTACSTTTHAGWATAAGPVGHRRRSAAGRRARPAPRPEPRARRGRAGRRAPAAGRPWCDERRRPRRAPSTAAIELATD